MKTVVVCLLGLVLMGAVCEAGVVYTSTLYSWAGTEPTLSPRIFRDGTPSTYPALKTFPGTLAETDFYQIYTLTASASAYGWIITPLVEDVYSFLSIYTGSFNPANLSANYLGDQGSSEVTASFSVPVSAGQTYVIVANGVSGTTQSLRHQFQFQVSEVPEPGTMAMFGAGMLAVLGLRRRK